MAVGSAPTKLIVDFAWETWCREPHPLRERELIGVSVPCGRRDSDPSAPRSRPRAVLGIDGSRASARPGQAADTDDV